MRWTIEMTGKRESGKSVLAARHDDDALAIGLIRKVEIKIFIILNFQNVLSL